MSQEMRDPLSRRLALMDVDIPSERVVQAALARAAVRPRRRHEPVFRLRTALAAAALLIITGLGVSYFVPSFGQALADTLIIGGLVRPVLDPIGLTNVSGHVTSLSDSATSNGYQLAVVGGYADAARTVLLVRINPAGDSVLLAGRDAVQLTDQFGRRYDLVGGYANTDSGVEALEFAPLAWPASSTGARLTLAVSSLGSSSPHRVAGDWQLHGTIDEEETTTLSVPAAGSLGGGNVRFSELAVTPNVLRVNLEISGLPLDGLTNAASAQAKGAPGMELALTDSQGLMVAPVELTIRDTQVSAVWQRPAAGRYDLTLSSGGATLSRPIQVP